MVEVPSARALADEIAGVVDFFSIGTNDLASTLAATDRMIGELSDLLDHWQPALLRAGRSVVARRAEPRPSRSASAARPASDPGLAAVLVGMSVTSLSVAPGALADVRATLATVSLADCERRAAAALDARDPAAARLAARA